MNPELAWVWNDLEILDVLNQIFKEKRTKYRIQYVPSMNKLKQVRDVVRYHLDISKEEFRQATTVQYPNKPTEIRSLRILLYLYLNKLKYAPIVNNDVPKEVNKTIWLADIPPNDLAVDEFYKTAEWKRLRYDVIERDGRKCACCGATPQDGIKINVDHIKPVRKNWSLRLDENNLQVLCSDCNWGKGNRYETDWKSS